MSHGRGKILGWFRHLMVALTIFGMSVPALPTVSASPAESSPKSTRSRTTAAFQRVHVLLDAVGHLGNQRDALLKLSAILFHTAYPPVEGLPTEESPAEVPSGDPLTSSESNPGETPSEPEPVDPADPYLNLSHREQFDIPYRVYSFLPSAPPLSDPALGPPRADLVGGAPSRSLPILLCRFTC